MVLPWQIVCENCPGGQHVGGSLRVTIAVCKFQLGQHEQNGWHYVCERHRVAALRIAQARGYRFFAMPIDDDNEERRRRYEEREASKLEADVQRALAGDGRCASCYPQTGVRCQLPDGHDSDHRISTLSGVTRWSQ